MTPEMWLNFGIFAFIQLAALAAAALRVQTWASGQVTGLREDIYEVRDQVSGVRLEAEGIKGQLTVLNGKVAENTKFRTEHHATLWQIHHQNQELLSEVRRTAPFPPPPHDPPSH